MTSVAAAAHVPGGEGIGVVITTFTWVGIIPVAAVKTPIGRSKGGVVALTNNNWSVDFAGGDVADEIQVGVLAGTAGFFGDEIIIIVEAAGPGVLTVRVPPTAITP